MNELRVMTCTSLDEPRRALIRGAMTAPQWLGVERGVYQIELDFPSAVSVEIYLEEAVLLRQVDRLLQRVVDRNRQVFDTLVGSDDPDVLLDRAWFVLEPVRCVHYAEGEYELRFPGDQIVRYYFTSWDCELLRRYDELLKRVYVENEEAVETALEEEA